MDAAMFAQKVCSHLDSKVDALDTKIMGRLDRVDKQLGIHAVQLATVATELRAERDTVKKLEKRVQELERADRKNEFTRGRLIGAAACVTTMAAGVGAAVAKALSHS